MELASQEGTPSTRSGRIPEKKLEEDKTKKRDKKRKDKKHKKDKKGKKTKKTDLKSSKIGGENSQFTTLSGASTTASISSALFKKEARQMFQKMAATIDLS